MIGCVVTTIMADHRTLCTLQGKGRVGVEILINSQLFSDVPTIIIWRQSMTVPQPCNIDRRDQLFHAVGCCGRCHEREP